MDKTARHALTGSIFVKDLEAVHFAWDGFRHFDWNFHINTKNTGSVVGQQPFGGKRGSSDLKSSIAAGSTYF